MLAINTAQPVPKQFSLFRRLTRKASFDDFTIPTQHVHVNAFNGAVQSPSRLRKTQPQSVKSTPPTSPTSSSSSPPSSPTSSMSSPPLSPAQSNTDSVMGARAPSPHLTKDKVYRKDRAPTLPPLPRGRSRKTKTVTSRPQTATEKPVVKSKPEKHGPITPVPQPTTEKKPLKDGRLITHTTLQHISIPHTISRQPRVSHSTSSSTSSVLSNRSNTSSTSSATFESQRVVPTSATLAKDFSSNPKIAPWNCYLSPSHVHALYIGHAPPSHYDHTHNFTNDWFIYSEGPDMLGKLKVHFHRSWVGIKVAEVFVVMDTRGEGAGKVVGVKWDAGGGRMTEWDAKEFVRRVASGVMDVELDSGE